MDSDIHSKSEGALSISGIKCTFMHSMYCVLWWVLIAPLVLFFSLAQGHVAPCMCVRVRVCALVAHIDTDKILFNSIC